MNQLVVQVRYHLLHTNPDGRRVPVGRTEWRDARSTDPREVAKVVGILGGIDEVAA